jgi:uncharacterized protein YbjT (DUF2867 family)
MVGTNSVAIFGGSGKTGIEVIAAALKNGLHVKALYRPGSEPKDVPNGLEVVTGQLTEPKDIKRTLEGTNGAIVVFGPRLGRGKNPQPFCQEATSKIITEMKALRIERLIVQTGAMAGGDNPNWSWFVKRFVRSYRRNYPAIDKDRDAQEVVTKQSGLDWTIARPFRISGARGKGHAHVAPAVRISAFTSIRRTDLAEFLVNEFTTGRFHGQIVYIIN